MKRTGLRAVADELARARDCRALRCHAPERRARQRVHRDHASEAPGGDQVVDLDLRAEADAEQARADARLVAMPPSPPKKPRGT